LIVTPQDKPDTLKNIAGNVNPFEIKKVRRDYIIGVENDTGRNLVVTRTE